MHRIFSAIFKQYMGILLQYISNPNFCFCSHRNNHSNTGVTISCFVHTGITIATQVSQFKKKVTHDDTFDIFIFLRNRNFQQNKAHGVDFSELLYFLSEKSRQNISNEDLDIYHFSKKT